MARIRRLPPIVPSKIHLALTFNIKILFNLLDRPKPQFYLLILDLRPILTPTCLIQTIVYDRIGASTSAIAFEFGVEASRTEEEKVAKTNARPA